MRFSLLLTLPVASLIPKTVFAFYTNPLNRECEWVHTRLETVQQNCVLGYFDPSDSKSWVDAANNEIHKVLTALKFNPIGAKTGVYFKTDVLTWARLIAIKVCGADASQIAQDFLGLKFYYSIILQALNPIYWALKGLSYAPKIGSFFKALSRGFEQPYKTFENLEKQLYDKCDKANTIVSNIFRLIDFLWYVQMASYIIDDLIIPASNMAICSSVNNKVKELISDNGGECSARRLRKRRGLSTTNSTDTARRLAAAAKDEFKKAFDDRRQAFNAVKNVADVINATITTFNDIVGPIEDTMDPIADGLQEVVDFFQPMIDYLEENKLNGLLEDMANVLKYVSCFVCDLIEEQIEKGINAILEAADLGTIEEFVDELLDPIYDLLPVDIDIDLTDFDFLNIRDAVQDVVDEVDDAIEGATELKNLARSVFDPSIDAAAALAKIDGGGDKTYFVTSENGQNVTFSCPGDYRPVVVSAQHTRYACTEDISAFMRFPCEGNVCTVQYSNVVLCPDVEPAGFDRFPFVTPEILHSTYICFPKSRNPKDLGIINDLQQYDLSNSNVHTNSNGPKFPISNTKARQIDTSTWAQISNPDCTLDRVVELDHWDSEPVPEVERYSTKWYFRSTRPSDKYYQDLAVSLFQLKSQETNFDPTDPDDPFYDHWRAEDTTYRWSYNCCDGTTKFECVKAFSNTNDCDFDTICPNTKDCTTGNTCTKGPELIWPGDIYNCSNFGVREAEYKFRSNIVKRYITMYSENVETCNNIIIPDCQGRKTCSMNECQRQEFDYACVFKPDFARQVLSFAFTKSRNPNSPVKEVNCGTGRKIQLVKAEIGRGFDTYDVTQYQSNNCTKASACKVDPDYLAREAGLANEVEPQTVRVETYCECPAGFEPEPLTNGTCVPCDFGAYRKDGMSRCQNCPEGTHSKNSTLVPLDDCVPCEKGTYNSETGSTECELCPLGTYNPNAGSTSIDDCIVVPPSHISSEDRSRKVECDEGYGNYPDNREECFPCGQGHIRSLGQLWCSPCDPGSYSPGPTGKICFAAAPGAYQARSGQAGFKLAPEDHYVNISNAVEPLECPPGTFTGRKGASSIDLCLPPQPVVYPDCASFASCDELLAFLNTTDDVLGDGFCWGDPRWCVNTALCSFDGGDCCPETCKPAELQFDVNETEDVKDFLKDYFEYSCHPSTFRCLAPRDLTAIDCSGRDAFNPPVLDPFENEACQPRSDAWGNGLCDPDQNFVNCSYDGGDCCMSTCRLTALEGSCARSTLQDCRDPSANTDNVAPTWHDLPGATLSLRCEDIPDWAPVSATDNDICFDGVVLAEEDRPQVCEAWTYIRRWTSTDPSNNTISFEQKMFIAADNVPPVWHNFPSNLALVFLNEESLHPDVTGWPQVTEECSMPVSVTWKDKVIIDEMQCGGDRYLERTWTATDNCSNAVSRIQRIDLKVTNSSVAFGEAWNLQFAAVDGDLSAKSPSILEGAVGSSRDVDLDKISVAFGSCAQAAAPFSVVAGSNVDAKSSHFDDWNPRPIYYVNKVKVGKTYEDLPRQEAIFDWASLAIGTFERSKEFAKTAALGGLFDGPQKQVCEEAEVSCRNDAGSEPAPGTTTGLVNRDGLNITLSGASPYLNVFEVSISDFFMDEKLCDVTWEFDAPNTALLIVNVRGSTGTLSPGSKGNKNNRGLKRSYHFKPPVFEIGDLRAEQILVNFPDVVDEKVLLESGTHNIAELPFSFLAPGLELDLRYVVVKGQVLVKSLETYRIHGSCEGLWWGNAPCEDANLKLDGGWSPWGVCEATDQNPSQCLRDRSCSNPNPAFGGQDCIGTKMETCDCGGSKGTAGKSNKGSNIFNRKSKGNKRGKSKGNKRGCLLP